MAEKLLGKANCSRISHDNTRATNPIESAVIEYWMAMAAPIVVSTIGMPSLFPMRHDDLESHRADLVSISPCRPVAQSQVYCVSFACLVRADNCANVFCFRSHA